MKVIKDGPNTYEQWIDSGRIIIPCLKGRPIIKNWQDPSFKVSKEEWKKKYTHCAMGVRLDQDVDFDIDNELAKRFIDKYAKSSGAIYGRPSNLQSHYWWKGTLDFKKFTLPKEFENYYETFPHGATLCEIRSSSSQYTIVPESKHSKADEHVKWEKYEGINEYPGNLNTDLRKVALSTALCILYGSQGQRDDYCTAVAGVLLKHTKWDEEEINEFVYNLAIESDDNEAKDRAQKGTSGKRAQRKFGIPKLAEIIGCTQKSVSEIFSWVGVAYETVQGSGAVGDIIEYGQDRYLVKVNTVAEGKPQIIEIRVDGPTLMNQKLFYDAVISKASVWIPKMPPRDFEEIMRKKYENKIKSKEYVEEANEDLVFKKRFLQYIEARGLEVDKTNLLEYKRPYTDTTKNSLEFILTDFEDFLEDKKIKIKRVDLVMDVQKILKAKKYNGKVKVGEKWKSCPSWRVENFNVKNKDLIFEGEVAEVKDTKEITDGS